MLIKTGGTLCRVEPFWMKCVFTEYTAFLLPRRRAATSEPRTREHAAPRRRAVWQATGQLWVWWLPETQCLFSGCASMLGVCVCVCGFVLSGSVSISVQTISFSGRRIERWPIPGLGRTQRSSNFFTPHATLSRHIYVVNRCVTKACCIKVTFKRIFLT